MLVDYAVVLQQNTANSTPEAEFVALSHGTLRGLIPMVSFLEALTRRSIGSATGSDSSTAISVVESGYSRKLAYLKKYQRVSIGVIHDWNAQDENGIYKLPTKRNPADVMTKPLDYEAHWAHLQRIGMEFLPMVEYNVEIDYDDETGPGVEEADHDDNDGGEPEGEEQVRKLIGAFAAALMRMEP